MGFRGNTVIEHPDRYEAAISARIKMNATKTRKAKWLAADATREGLVEWLTTASYDKGGFLLKMFDAYQEWGSLTEGQEAAVRRSFEGQAAKKAEWAAQDAKSVSVGEVGKRVEFAGLTLLGVFEDEGMYGMTYAHKFKDAAGNIFHWKSSAGVIAEKGEIVTVKATVKGHHVSKAGVKSTILSRCKLVGEPQPGAAQIAKAEALAAKQARKEAHLATGRALVEGMKVARESGDEAGIAAMDVEMEAHLAKGAAMMAAGEI